jgi:hypothetical protein
MQPLRLFAGALAVLAFVAPSHAQDKPQERIRIEHPAARWYPAPMAWKGAETSLIVPGPGDTLRQTHPFLDGATPHVRFGCSSAEKQTGNALIVEVIFNGARKATTPAEKAYIEGTRALLGQPGVLTMLDSQGKVIATTAMKPLGDRLITDAISDATRSAMMISHSLRIDSATLALAMGTVGLRDAFNQPALRNLPCIDTRF